MRNFYSIIIVILISNFTFSQNNVSDKKLIVYDTYEDFIANKGIDYGFITGTSNDSWGGNKIYVGNEDKDKAIGINKFWGFKIGDFLFRMNKYSVTIPMLVVKEDNKVFYLDGYLYLKKAIYNQEGGSSFRESDGVFYSDNLNSEVFEITKMISKEKDNPDLKELIECLKKAKKRYGIQAKFNSYCDCTFLDKE